MIQLLALSILFITVALSLGRPSIGRIKIQPAGAAVFGAALTVAAGLLSIREVAGVLGFLAAPVLTIVSLMLITLIAARAGFFRALAWKLAADARGDARKLFRHLFLAGTLTGMVFTNDAAVLIFTPMVYGLVEEIGGSDWTAANKIPFYFGVLYVGNLVGALVISNPINIVMSRWFDIGFVEYALWMVIPALVSIAVTYLGLVMFFRRSLPERYRLPKPVEPECSPLFRRVCGTVLVITLLGFFCEGWTGIPTAFVAAAGAVILLIAYYALESEKSAPVIREVGWDAVIFMIGIFVVAHGLRTAGLTDAIGGLLYAASEVGAQAGTVATSLVAAVSSAVMNNHPTTGMMALAIGDLPLEPTSAKLLAMSALIGGDLGPKMLPIGSLAALLWIRILRTRGVEISYLQYVKLGVPVTFAAVACSLLALNLEYLIFLAFR